MEFDYLNMTICMASLQCGPSNVVGVYTSGWRFLPNTLQSNKSKTETYRYSPAYFMDSDNHSMNMCMVSLPCIFTRGVVIIHQVELGDWIWRRVCIEIYNPWFLHIKIYPIFSNTIPDISIVIKSQTIHFINIHFLIDRYLSWMNSWIVC